MRVTLRRALVTLSVLSSAGVTRAQTDVLPSLWGTDEPVEGVAVLEDTLFISGSFGYVGPPTGQVAVLDKATGEADLAWPRFESVELGALGVTDVVPDGAGGFFAGGNFSFVSGQSRDNLARVRPDGTLDPAFIPNPGTPEGSGLGGAVYALALNPSATSPSGAGVLYVAGGFSQIGGGARQHLAALDATTGLLLPLAATFGYAASPVGPYLTTLAHRDGVLYVSGYFDTVNGQPRQGVAALNASTGALLAWDPRLRDAYNGALPRVTAFAFVGSSLYVGGTFDRVHEQVREGLAEVSLADPATGAGGEPTAWAPDLPGIERLTAIDLVPVGGALYAAGGFLAGAPLVRVDRTTAVVQRLLLPPSTSEGFRDGTSLAFEPGAGPSGAGLLYLGCERIAPRRPVVIGVDVATGQTTGFEILGGSGEDPNKDVRALAVTPGPDGRLVAGGSFTSLGGVARYSLAALDLTTGRPTDLDLGLDRLFAEDLALSPDGRYLYGYVSELGGAALGLRELDLATGTIREFAGPGRSGAPEAGSGPAHDGAAPTAPVPVLGRSGAGRGVPPRPAVAGVAVAGVAGTPYVANGPSALAVTADRVCVSSLLACLDRATGDVVWQQTGAIYVARDNGDVLLLEEGGPGGASGTLYVAAPLAQIPSGTPHAGYVALDFATGAVLPFEVGASVSDGAEAFAVARLDTDGAGPAPPTVYFGGDRTRTVQGADRLNTFAVSEPAAALVPWSPRIQGGQGFFPWEPVMSMLAVPRRAEDGGGGVVYVAGASGPVGLPLGGAVAFDAVSGAVLPWDVRPDGADITSGHVRHVVPSPRHGAVFLAGGFQGVLRGSGHAGVVGVSPAAPFVPVAGEPGGVGAPAASLLALAGPNPFRSRTALALSLAEGQHVDASLFDVLGRRVAVLHDGALAAGAHTISVDGSALPAGVYVARVDGPGVAASVTLTVVR